MVVVNALVQGILLGGVFAMAALGLSIAFGVLRVVNLAHGEIMTVGAYIAAIGLSRLGISVWISLILVVPVLGFAGYWVQRLLLQRALRIGELAPLLVTFGLAIIIPNALIELFTTNKQTIPTGDLAVRSITIVEGVSIGVLPLLTMIVAVLLIAGTQLYLTRTRTGRYMRAAADDSETLRLMGVDHRRVYALAMGLAFGIAALAGVFFGMRQGGVTPFDGHLAVLFAFEAVIIGGLGSLWGTLAGGVVLGVAQTLAGVISPELPLLVGNLVFLAVLMFRPTGIVRSKVAV
ncbi:branched-chain amino acid ABC transporter permease [Demequina capsici]|uniref:Branched-chain amino acid ABC transporter permease n=1 Tax=Demequina capsici TaxID=3075620 RepID=A0AA96FES4_9MICO|nr:MULTISPECIES: branched-chain amino acid ABC transporter permease [unclassified Demequina]WNM24417.1 branched-chain amino acid ABC transporter permease [Demequina sp. OYTSA14]WNM27251.1 branched-chain amino acid ABC transporter permease [Demequina sp. PMTSA13]